MKEKVLGTYTVRKAGNANSVTIPVSTGLKKGDSVVLILKPNGNLEIKKEKSNFWDEAPKMSVQEKKVQIEDLGYDPLGQKAKGKERIED
ncbi:hypothetical protein BC335_1010 [Lactobacillus helveticus]|uniref:AbrB family transcriptional regulator n=1 Tax=Lactobacillus helveticus TaxID=1587 RepID=A0A386REH5_LACHE|nr:hypothetical protein [Lactobacillus helveticus]AYE61494.1 hypothetical protein BC335_1010 [Lactobacillus helveticus]MCD9225480.1 hypothetical protein [Lactobacillus helveticus]